MKTSKLREYKDNRGSLLECVDPEIMEQSAHMFVSTSKKGVVRGNHYHHRKSEWFLIIKGKARIYVEDIKTKEREELEVSAEDAMLVNMEPLKAHAIENIGNEEMVMLALINEVFSQEDPDTFEYKVR